MNWRKYIKLILLVSVILVLVSLVFLLIKFSSSPAEETESKFDIHEEIALLNSECELWDQYVVDQLDWKVWKEQMEAIDVAFLKMDSWSEFKESLKQNPLSKGLGLDEERRIIWFVSFAGIVIYLQY